MVRPIGDAVSAGYAAGVSDALRLENAPSATFDLDHGILKLVIRVGVQFDQLAA
jgi:hypothetical protein